MKPSLLKWMQLALFNWIEIALIFYAIFYFNYWVVDVIGIVLLGTRQHALALLAHEAIHGNISKNRFINNFWGSLFSSLPIFQSLSFFKKFHLDHHAFMLTEKDPEVHIRRSSPKRWGIPLTKNYRFKIFMRDICGLGYFDTRHAYPFVLPSITLVDVFLPIAYWLVIIFVSINLHLGWIPLYWVIAHLTSYWAMFRQRALTEHVGSDPTQKIIANPVQRFFYLPHNTWFHYEHHLNPKVPCWNLPKMRTLLKESGYISVSDMFNKLALEGRARSES